jgi:hypothetical protein
VWDIIACILVLSTFTLLIGGIAWGLATAVEKRFGEAHRAEEMRKLDREAEHIARHLVSMLYHEHSHLPFRARVFTQDTSDTMFSAV